MLPRNHFNSAQAPGPPPRRRRPVPEESRGRRRSRKTGSDLRSHDLCPSRKPRCAGSDGDRGSPLARLGSRNARLTDLLLLPNQKRSESPWWKGFLPLRQKDLPRLSRKGSLCPRGKGLRSPRRKDVLGPRWKRLRTPQRKKFVCRGRRGPRRRGRTGPSKQRRNGGLTPTRKGLRDPRRKHHHCPEGKRSPSLG